MRINCLHPVTFVLLASIASTSNAGEYLTSGEFAKTHLIPLMQKSYASIKANPVYYPHGEFGHPLFDVAIWIKKHEGMNAFSNIPLNSKWNDLSTSKQEIFIELLEQAKSSLNYIGEIAPMSEIWREARANRDLDVSCCGNHCQFRFRYGQLTNYEYLDIITNDGSSSCKLDYGYPIEFKYNDPYPYNLKDLACNGDLENLASRIPGLDTEIARLYRNIIELLDPVEGFARFDKSPCDV